MGCCMSHSPPPIVPVDMTKVGSFTETTVTKSANPLQFRQKQEPYLTDHDDHDKSTSDKRKETSFDKSTSKQTEEVISEASTHEEHKPSDHEDSSYTPEDAPTAKQTEFREKIEERKSELLREKQKLKALQSDIFAQQIKAQQSQNFRRLYDIWQEFATNSDKTRMDIDGLTSALNVFGMIIDTDRDFQKHIFSKFDLDNEKEITYNDFSATIASFVGSNTDDDSLQTLFEIFDIDQDGYLELEDMARILLAQNQIAVVVTGQQSESTKTKYTKKQCLKQARRMVAEYDSDQFNDNKISFAEYRQMMNSRTENDMMIDHMQAPSISINSTSMPLDITSYAGSRKNTFDI